MLLRFRPGLPILRRGDGTVQLGPGPDALRLEQGPTFDRLLTRLGGSGARRESLIRELGRLGATPDAVEALLDRLEPALARTSAPRSGAIALRGPGAERLAARLEPQGIACAPWDDRLPRRRPRQAPLALAVELASGRVPARRMAEAMSVDLPHLPIAALDGTVTIGPLVIPGETACLRCAELTAEDEDPAWPVLAAQLERWPGLDPLAGPLALELAVATIVARVARGERALEGRSISLGPDGVPAPRPAPSHAACACRALPGTGSAPAGPPPARRSSPSSAAGAAGPA